MVLPQDPSTDPIARCSAGFNFDNVIEALCTLFAISMRNGWVDIMHNGMDVTKVDAAPERNALGC